MNAIRTISRLELRLLRVDPRTTIVVGLVLGAVALALVSASHEVNAQARTVEEARLEHEARLASAREGSGWLEFPTHEDRVPVVSFVAPVPPARFALLSLGHRDVLPQALAWVPEENATHSPPEPSGDGRVLYGLYPVEVTSAPIARLLGPFDLAFVVVFLLPLAVLALTFDLLGRERERGTLVLVRSQPVGLASLVLGKLIVRGCLVLGLGVVAPIVVVAAVSPAAASGGHSSSSLLLWGAAVALYTVFWLGVGAWVDSRSRTSGSSAVTLAGMWLAVVLLLPAAVVQTAERIAPPPSTVRFAQETRPLPELAYHEYSLTYRAAWRAFEEAYTPPSDLDDEEAELHRAAAWAEMPVPAEITQRPWIQSLLDRELDWATPLSYWQATGAAKEAERQETERRSRPIIERHQAEEARHLSTARWLSLLSPALLVQEVMDVTAGADLARHKRFRDELGAYARDIEAPFVEAMKEGRAISPDAIAEVQPFEFRDSAERHELWSAVAMALAGLLAYAVVGGGLVARAAGARVT